MPRKLNKLLKATAAHIEKRGEGKLTKSDAFAVATSALQSAGLLKSGTNTLTKAGRNKRVTK